MIGKHLKTKPNVHPSAFVAPGVKIIGAVTVGEKSSIWYNTVIRADINQVQIGKRVNIQDGCLLHLEDDRGIKIEDDVTIGHGAILHACTVKKGALIGMGAIVLNGAVVGERSLVGAGALIPPGMKVPAGMLAIGSPAKVKRKLTAQEIKKNQYWAEKYGELAKEYLENA